MASYEQQLSKQIWSSGRCFLSPDNTAFSYKAGCGQTYAVSKYKRRCQGGQYNFADYVGLQVEQVRGVFDETLANVHQEAKVRVTRFVTVSGQPGQIARSHVVSVRFFRSSAGNLVMQGLHPVALPSLAGIMMNAYIFGKSERRWLGCNPKHGVAFSFGFYSKPPPALTTAISAAVATPTAPPAIAIDTKERPPNGDSAAPPSAASPPEDKVKKTTSESATPPAASPSLKASPAAAAAAAATTASTEAPAAAAAPAAYGASSTEDTVKNMVSAASPAASPALKGSSSAAAAAATTGSIEAAAAAAASAASMQPDGAAKARKSLGKKPASKKPAATEAPMKRKQKRKRQLADSEEQQAAQGKMHAADVEIISLLDEDEKELKKATTAVVKRTDTVTAVDATT